MAYSQATYQTALSMVQSATPEQMAQWTDKTAFEAALANAGLDPESLDPAMRDQLIVMMMGYSRSQGS